MLYMGTDPGRGLKKQSSKLYGWVFLVWRIFRVRHSDSTHEETNKIVVIVLEHAFFVPNRYVNNTFFTYLVHS